MAHPVRLQILSLLTGAELSAAEVARELGITQANASYHVRRLVEAGHLEHTATEQVRGGTAKKYRYVAHLRQGPRRDPRTRSARTDDDFVQYVEALTSVIRQRAPLRHRDLPAESADAEVWLDPDVWEQTVRHSREASRLVHESARPPRSAGTIHVSFTTALFGMKDPT